MTPLISHSIWETITPHLGKRVHLNANNGTVIGRLQAIRIHQDGSATVTFTDHTILELEPLRSPT